MGLRYDKTIRLRRRVFFCLNTLRPRQKGRQFPDNIFKFIYLNKDIWILRFGFHWNLFLVRVTHICVDNLTIIGPDNGLLPGQPQAIIWADAGILLIGPWGTNFSEILIGIHTFSLKKIHLQMASAKWRPFCLGLNVLKCGRLALGGALGM